MTRTKVLATCLSAFVLLVTAPSAFAATRHASPAGSGTACSSAAPCTIQEAFTGSHDGDEIVLASGDYGSPGSPISDQLNADWKRLDVHGVAGQPLPRIYSDASDHIMHLSAFNSTAAYMELHWTGGPLGNALIGSFSSIDHVRVVSNGGGIYVQDGTASLTATNISSYSTGDGYSAAFAIADYPTAANYTATLRNLTAVATDQYSSGLAVNGSDPSGAHPVHVDVHNSILRGGLADISAGAQDIDDVTVVALDHSNFEVVQTYGGGNKSVTSPITDNNQLAKPLFVDLPGGDLHQAVGSPTVDAGAVDAANGATDIDGDARVLGSTTDIGADEYVPPAPVNTGDKGGSNDQSGPIEQTPNGGPDTTPPVTGPQPTVVTAAPRCVVPKLAGKTLKAATAALRKAHCAVGKVTRKANSRKAGRVLKQAKKPGARLRAGSKVALVVARSA